MSCLFYMLAWLLLLQCLILEQLSAVEISLLLTERIAITAMLAC